MKAHLTGIAALLMASAGAAQAHVGVQPATAVAGAEQTLRFVVGHGCDGQPTTALRVELPAGVSKLEPEPKAGWTAAVERLKDGGHVVTWRGELPPHQPDGFEIKARMPAAPGPLRLPATQACDAVTVRWDDAASADGPRPAHPAPSLTLTAADQPAPAGPKDERLPKGVQRQPDGALADATGKPLYTFNYDTMVGMSHCEDDCAQMWPPLRAPKDAKAFGDWTLIPRGDGAAQWALKDKPLYTYAKDQPGQPAQGLEAPNWKRAK